ncbi:ATP-binding protein [Nonomuraea zeae]|uniref:ATP-binding protein n=1 Tax=Nonomuraea zeae TaxID=1642303 RepID=A0A5S4GVC9_9ACTN|nr:ATP-binding protein [Nonomuraea zeae]TMR36461.1 ATP-binding protein [Nonomuraea zeae]
MAEFLADDSWYALLQECLHKNHPPGAYELPVILLLGLPGTGKSATLAQIAGSIGKPHSPVVSLALHSEPHLAVADVVQRLAYHLEKLNGVKMPRTVFTLVVLGLNAELEDTRLAAQLEEQLRRKPRITREDLKPWEDLAGLLPDIGIYLKVAIGLAELFGRRFDAVGHVHGTARSWLAGRVGGNILDLARDQHLRGGDRPAFAQGILLEAFLEDLAQAWMRRRYPRNLLLTLDDAETPVVTDFLQALVAARARRAQDSAPADPLVLVAASKTWPKGVTGWTRPGTPGPVRPPLLAESSYDDWMARRGQGEQGWWYPVLLPPLPDGRARAPYASAVHDLTRGYQRATRELTELLRSAGDDHTFRGILHSDKTLHRLLPDHLPQRERLVAWSAVRNVDDAENTSFEGTGSASHLRQELADQLWLTTQSEEANRSGEWAAPGGAEVTVLHPWLRRLLLHRLAAREAHWDQVHEALERFYGGHDGAVMYHKLARVTAGDDPELAAVVAFLSERIGPLDTQGRRGSRLQEWIHLYEQVSSAPNRLPLDVDGDVLYDSLAVDPAQTERRERTAVIRELVVARWFWLDPLLDPSGRRTDDIAREFRHLAGFTKTGRAIFTREAERYEQRPRR